MPKHISFFSYPGAKNRLKETIAPFLAQSISVNTNRYVEPFFGAGSIGIYFASLYPKNISKIWINDVNISLSCLWTSVIKYPDDLMAKVMFFKPTLDAYHEFKEIIMNLNIIPKTKQQTIEYGFKKLALHQMSYSATVAKACCPLGGIKQTSVNKIHSRWYPKKIVEKIKFIKNVFDKYEVKNNECSCLDYKEILDECGENDLVYLDPPYRLKRKDVYQEMFKEEDHIDLSLRLKFTKAKWALSYNDDKIIKDLYDWADVKEINAKYTLNKIIDIDNLKKEIVILPNAV